MIQSNHLWHAGDTNSRHYDVGTVAKVRLTLDGRQDIFCSEGWGVAIPHITYTVRRDDVLRLHFRSSIFAGRPLAAQINGGPWVEFERLTPGANKE